MKALLLAGGYGTRLRPLTDRVPKCLVEIDGEVLLQIWLDTLSKAGVSEFLINTHYLNEQVEAFVKQSPQKDKITLVHEENLLGTGGTIVHNKDFFDKNDSFMVVHADNLSLCDYKDFISAHSLRPKNTLMSMMTFRASNPKECGIVKVDAEGIVEEFYEKIQSPPSNLANGAVYIFEYEIISLLESLEKKTIDISTELIPLLCGKIYTYLNSNIHIDIGTYKNYKTAQRLYKNYKSKSKFLYFQNYFTQTNSSLLRDKIKEISSKLQEQKQALYKKRRVLAIYDCIDLPLSNDISTFIMSCEAHRRKYALEKIDLVFVVHASDPSPTRHDYVTPTNVRQFVYNMAIEQSRMFENIGSLFVFDNRNEFLDFYSFKKKDFYVYPADYNASLPMEAIRRRHAVHEWHNLIPFVCEDSSLLCLTPPDDQIKLARKWITKYIYPKIPITITLREWDTWVDERNSKITEWQKFIKFYEGDDRFIFIVVRDYYKLYDEKDPLNGINVIYCNEAALSNSFRSALYQEATLNLFVSNGSAMTAIANYNVRYIFFSIYSNARGTTREVLRDTLGLYYGDSFHGSSKFQKVVWQRDTFGVLRDETEKMLQMIENDFGLEPLFYTKSDEEIYAIQYIEPKSAEFYKQVGEEQRASVQEYLLFFYIFSVLNLLKISISTSKNFVVKLYRKVLKRKKSLYSYIGLKYKVFSLKMKIFTHIEITKRERNGVNAQYPHLLEYINDIVSSNKMVLVYGAGTIGKALYPILYKNILYYIDSNTSISGQKNKQIECEIRNLDALSHNEESYDYIIITPEGREDEIANNLINNYFIEKNKLIIF